MRKKRKFGVAKVFLIMHEDSPRRNREARGGSQRLKVFLLILLLSGTKYGEKGDWENPSLFEKVSAELAHAL